MRIFYIAEITGKVGVWAVKKNIAEIKRRYQPDFIIANAGMATGAGGLGSIASPAGIVSFKRKI